MKRTPLIARFWPAVFLLAPPAGAQDKDLAKLLPPLKAISPTESLRTFRVEKGFALELAAAEPDVTDPVDIDWDEDGRMYVCELWNYPMAPKPGGVLGRIRMLEDLDGDGRYEKSTIFADKVAHPGGVIPWAGGVYVLSTPDLLYLKDTDGDGKADVRKAVYTGFTGTTYKIPNSLRWGLDNRIYGASSYAGGHVQPAGDPRGKAVDIGRGRDFRFDPRGGAFEPVTGSAEFGNTIDDWGNRFISDANTCVKHGVIPYEYLGRNPYLAVSRTTDSPSGSWNEVFAISEPEPWRVVRQKFWSRFVDSNNRMVASNFPASELQPRGVATAVAGVTVYRGSAYPEAYRNNAFCGEPANNLVMRLPLHPEGAGFKTSRPGADTKTEFIASTDPRFRPVNLANGPDGCLYVVTMYREVIEDHLDIPPDIVKNLDLDSGRDMGRVYRVVPEGFARPKTPKLGNATTRELVAAVGHPDAWRRNTAQRLLYERQDRTAVAPLRSLAQGARLPQGRIQALWSLRGLGSLDQATVLRALGDENAHVREHAVKLAEPFLGKAAGARVAALAGDPEPRVRFQVALSLSGTADARAVPALVRIARSDFRDVWIRTALLTAMAERSAPVFKALVADADYLAHKEAAELLGQLAQIIATRNRPSEVGPVLGALGRPALPEKLRRILVTRLGDGLARAGSSLSAQLDRHHAQGSLAPFFASAQALARDESKPTAERVEAIGTLVYAPYAATAATFGALLEPVQPQDIQRAVVRALGAENDPAVAKVLVDRWPTLGPAVRPDVVEAVFRRTERLGVLLDAVQADKIAMAELEPARRRALLTHENESIRERANKLLGSDPKVDRQKIVARYRAAVPKLPTDARRGAEVFAKTCAVCHQKDAEGRTVGPDLASLQDRLPDTLLNAILDPNKEVKPAFINYVLMASDEQIYTGIITAETATSVTLRRAGGAQDSILRKNIKSLTSTSLSLMPEGLEAAITEGQMADLLRYVQQLR